MNLWWLIPIIIAVSVYLGYSLRHRRFIQQKINLPQNYLLGLNFLLNEEPDKAVDVFIKMLEVDSNMVETHLAVGNLFRRRGEVDRAIRIHQNLIARSQLDQAYREQSLYELGQDYLYAGMLDRAERIFLEMVNSKEHAENALTALLDIYQQEKMWEKAIQMAYKLENISKKNMHAVIAHYYCELAEEKKLKKQNGQAQLYLSQALDVDHQCARASLLQAELEISANDYQSALKTLKRIKNQNPQYLSEAIEAIAHCYEKLNEEEKLVTYLMQILEEYPRGTIVMKLSEYIRKLKGEKIAANFVADYVRRYPSLGGINLFINLYLSSTEGRARQDLLILQSLMKKLLADKPDYQCVSCGFSGKAMHWHCPGCKQWNSIKPIYALEEPC